MNIALNQLLESLTRGDYEFVEKHARLQLSQNRFYFTHLILIQVLIETDRVQEADAEFATLMSYKFNIAERLEGFPDILNRYKDLLGDHFILSTMKPGISFEIQQVHHKIARWDIQGHISSRPKFAEEVRRQIKLSTTGHKRLPVDNVSICTFGSCFAANLTRILISKGLRANNLLIEESINSTYANRTLLELICGLNSGRAHLAIRNEFGESLIENIKSKLMNSSHIVLTVGVAPSFFDTESGEFVFAEKYSQLLEADRVRMRSTTCTENLDNLRVIFKLLNQIAPAAQKFVTLSPVPLAASTEMSSILIADCVSKSTLRAAVHEITIEFPEITYFPAFELTRWLSAYTSEEVFAADDGNSRHVSNWVVECIVDSFIETFL